MRPALRSVERRWATTNVVLPRTRESMALCTFASEMESRLEVASSSSRIGAFFSSARAMFSLCAWPSEMLRPPVPRIVS